MIAHEGAQKVHEEDKSSWAFFERCLVRSFLHRRTFFAVLVVDLVLYPSALYLASIDIKPWAIEAPMLMLNLPSFPVAIVYSVIGDDPHENFSRPTSIFLFASMLTSLILTSSADWAFVVAAVLRTRKTAPAD